MSKRVHLCACIFLFLIIVICPAFNASATIPRIKVSVFNFTTVNLEASGYNTMVANMLMSNLGCESSLSILERKELEAFLSMNDLQQDDNLENVTHIGSRLGLSAVVVGSHCHGDKQGDEKCDPVLHQRVSKDLRACHS